MARDLLDEVTDEERAAWRASTPIDWANESFEISTKPAVQYCVGTGAGCWYDTDNERLEPGEPKRGVTIERSHIEAQAPAVRNQLVKAGVRLERC